MVQRLGSKSTVFSRTETQVPGLTLHAEEQALLDAVDGRKTLYDLVNTPPLSASDNARIFYGLMCLGLVESREPRQIKVQLRTDGGQYQ